MRVRYGTFVHLTYMFFALAANIASRSPFFSRWNSANLALINAPAGRIFDLGGRSSGY